MNELKILEKNQLAIKDESSIERVKSFLMDQVSLTKDVSISNPFNKAEVESVDKMRRTYVTNRNTIARTFKADRDGHTEHNRKNREAELEVLALMEEEETRLSDCVNRARLEAVKEDRKKLIPFRNEELSKYDSVVPSEELLELDDREFEKLLLVKKESFLAKEAVRQNEERIREEARKEAEAAAAQALAEEKERSRLAAKKAEEDKAFALAKAEAERLAGIKMAEMQKAEAVRMEVERQAKEKQDAIDKGIAEKEALAREKAKAEKDSKFKDFLKGIDYDDSSMDIKQLGGGTYEVWTRPVLISSITI